MNPNYYGAEPNPGNSAPLMATYTQKEIYNLVEKYFAEFRDSYPLDAKPVFIYQSVPMQNGVIKRFDEKDFSTFAKTKPEGSPTKRAQYGIGYHKDVIMKTIGLEMALTEESIKFNKWDDVKTIGVELGKTVPNRINLDMTHFAVTFAQSSSYVDMDGFTIDETTGDGQPLASAGHTLAFSPLTYTNIVPGGPQFSKSALISAEIIARNNIVDNYGIPKSMKMSHIFSTGNPQIIESVQQFLRSISDNTQANPNVENTYQNRYKLLVLEQIDTDIFGRRDTTKSNWWGIGAFEGDVKGKRFTAIYAEWEAPHMKPAPTADNNANDFSRDIQKYGTRGRYNMCALNGLGIVYSFAANS